jgi:hypothetical protein
LLDIVISGLWNEHIWISELKALCRSVCEK